MRAVGFWLAVVFFRSFLWSCTCYGDLPDRKNGISIKSKEKISEKTKEINLTTVYFPTDHGRWTDLIVSSFEGTLINSGLPINFQRTAWIYRNNNREVIQKVAANKPDIVFLPNDDMYALFAREIHEKTGAIIFFAAFHSHPTELNKIPINAQGGVFHHHPIEKSMRTVQKIFNIKTVGIVQGPCTQRPLTHLKKALPGLIAEVYETDSYIEYAKKTLEFSKKYSAVWPMAPFGVFDERTGQWVSESEMQILLDSLDKPSLGWGYVNNMRRTIEFSISPHLLGKIAGKAALDYLNHKKLSVTEIDRYDIRIYAHHVKKFNVQVPLDLLDNLVSIQ